MVEGVRCVAVDLRRPDIVRGDRRPQALLAGQRIHAVRRHGKQMALISDAGSTICIHLGMTGSLFVCTHRRSRTGEHHHIHWRLTQGRTLVFRDPRRFGGIWTFPSIEALMTGRWSLLGPDALTIRARELHPRLAATRRPLKAALLDQAALAGLGNIYIDELLFRCRLAPSRPAWTLSMSQVQHLITTMRRLLHRAIACGGSSVRDYVDSQGACGQFQLRHQVYGRGGQSCRRCGQRLTQEQIAGRTTVFCPHCQAD